MPDENQNTSVRLADIAQPKRPPDIVLPIGQPLPPAPGIEWWLRKMMSGR